MVFNQQRKIMRGVGVNIERNKSRAYESPHSKSGGKGYTKDGYTPPPPPMKKGYVPPPSASDSETTSVEEKVSRLPHEVRVIGAITMDIQKKSRSARLSEKRPLREGYVPPPPPDKRGYVPPPAPPPPSKRPPPKKK